MKKDFKPRGKPFCHASRHNQGASEIITLMECQLDSNQSIEQKYNKCFEEKLSVISWIFISLSHKFYFHLWKHSSGDSVRAINLTLIKGVASTEFSPTGFRRGSGSSNPVSLRPATLHNRSVRHRLAPAPTVEK